ncbi:MAG TPA: rhomboid family intramembrane serine protease [Thermoleophilaceae bacterium]|nr:rhomboid family intramembrane serine protease [Thermoleophilaceae bacterium]
MSQPDLFVVCRNCGSEVSPYVTECPYCGQRIRKRAPKIERDEEGGTQRRRRRRPRLSRLRADEIEGIAPDRRPVATLLLIALSLAVTLVLASDQIGLDDVGGIWLPLDDAPWRFVTAPFVHDSLAYQFVALVAVGVFGTLLERRFGALAPLAVFLLAGAAGSAAAVAVDLAPPFENLNVGYWILGANGAALGLLCAWLVDDRRAARRGEERGNDLIGVAVFAAVLVLLPLAVAEASFVAGVVGAATGALLGFALPLLARR